MEGKRVHKWGDAGANTRKGVDGYGQGSSPSEIVDAQSSAETTVFDKTWGEGRLAK